MSNIVIPAKKPQAIALVQAGLTIAVMIGVPFGSFLGGFANWRTVFGVMILLAIITMLGMIKFVPKVSLSAEANIAKELKVMDATAITMCMESKLPIMVFKLAEPGCTIKALNNESLGTIVR